MELINAIIGRETHTIFLNYLSFGAFLIAIFCFLTGLFLLTIKEKSPSTLHLGLGFMMLFPFNLSIAFAQTYYDPLAAYHRWASIAFISLTIIFFTQFVFYFPRNLNERISRIFLGVQLFILACSLIFFCIKTYDAPRVYYFTGHYWDFFAKIPSMFIAGIIGLFILGFFVVGIVKFLMIKTKDRWALLVIVLGFLMSSVIPALTNIMSREGSLDRGIHQSLTVTLYLVGLFLIIIVYVNNTKDTTTLMVRIVGVTLVTLLLFVLFLGLVPLRDREEAFAASKAAENASIVETGDLPPDLVYQVELNMEDPESSVFYRRPERKINFDVYYAEMVNTVVREEIDMIEDVNFREDAKETLGHGGRIFEGYRRSLLAYLETRREEGGELKQILLERIADLNNMNIVHYTRISFMTPEDFRQEITDYIRGQNEGDFLPFYKAIERRLADRTLQGAALKAAVMRVVAPIRPARTRLYRQSVDGLHHYVAYIHYVRFNREMYEMAYPYREYRAFIHTTTWKLTVFLLVVIFAVLVIYPLFFRGGLVIPLRDLMQGLNRVYEGDLSVEVPVRAQDEIGFLANSFNDMVISIRVAGEQLQYNFNNLEEKVKERTSELNKTLDQIRALKNQQDGDYFLTSLLSRPLSLNANKSKLVSSEFFIRQMKTFEFRNKKAELGGDICISGNLRLGIPDEYRRFTVIINADAMGKSMQGAVGSLVLGVMVNSIIARSAKNDRILNRTPERWLTDTFNELTTVFNAFNGSMVISAVFLLICDDTGEMYYFNAEHPYMVLMRNGRVTFIEKELRLRKIGLESEFPFQVFKFQLQPEDIVILGTDGRDDIDFTPEKENRTLNEDEFLFMEQVEKANGNLTRLVKNIGKLGALTDDIALVRVGYKEKVKVDVSEEFLLEGPARAVIDIDLETETLDDRERVFEELFEKGRMFALRGNKVEALELLKQAYDIHSNDPTLNKVYGVLAFKQKRYLEAVEVLENYLKDEPENIDFWLYFSIAQKRIGNTEKALEAANRVHKLNPRKIHNLIQLADLHHKMGNHDKARKFIESALEQEPDNVQAKVLQTALF